MMPPQLAKAKRRAYVSRGNIYRALTDEQAANVVASLLS